MLNKQRKSFPLSFNTNFCKKGKFSAQNELSLWCWPTCLCSKAWSQNCSVVAFCFVLFPWKNPKKQTCAFIKRIYTAVINTLKIHWLFQRSFFNCTVIHNSNVCFKLPTPPEVTVIVLAVDWYYLQTYAPILKKNHATSSLYVMQVKPFMLIHQNIYTLKLTVLYLQGHYSQFKLYYLIIWEWALVHSVWQNSGWSIEHFDSI